MLKQQKIKSCPVFRILSFFPDIISYLSHKGKLSFRIYTFIVNNTNNILILQQIKNICFHYHLFYNAFKSLNGRYYGTI